MVAICLQNQCIFSKVGTMVNNKMKMLLVWLWNSKIWWDMDLYISVTGNKSECKRWWNTVSVSRYWSIPVSLTWFRSLTNITQAPLSPRQCLGKKLKYKCDLKCWYDTIEIANLACDYWGHNISLFSFSYHTNTSMLPQFTQSSTVPAYKWNFQPFVMTLSTIDSLFSPYACIC